MPIAERLQKLRQKLLEREIEAILISQPENRRYLSGFSGSAGYLLITANEAILTTDFRYIEQAQKQAPDYEIFRTGPVLEEWFPRLLGEFSFRRLGFEAEHMAFAEYHRINDVLDELGSHLRLVPEESLVESLRAVKEAAEISLITRAAEISDRALEYAEAVIYTGMTERELAWEMEQFMRKQGSEALPFEIIVVCGPSAALPHAQPSDDPIQPGKPVLIDIGACCDGYCSDISRALCLGTPDDNFTRLYAVILGAQTAAIEGIAAGMTGEEADGLARDFIEKAGYGDAFGHSLGHGVGLAPHENPRLGPRSEEILVDGMVFTIEPGVYLSGWGGIRIEDLFLMTEGKARAISQARKG